MRSVVHVVRGGLPHPEPESCHVGTHSELARQLLSLSREAGTPEAARARELISNHLITLGYKVDVQKFTFSPASLRAFPIFGAGLGGLALVLLPFLYSTTLPSWGAFAVWLAGLLALLTVVIGVGLGWAPLGEALREDANLIATRGRPRRWIVAHLDTKAQGHSMAGRLVAVWTTVGAILLLTILALIRLGGPLSPLWLALGAGFAVASGFLAGRGRLRGRSQGARDNGSGVVAALVAAEATTDPHTGILITSAEEFGLIGARVFARLTPDLGEMEFVNLDTIDEEGKLYLVSHDRRGERLARALALGLEPLGLAVKLRRLPLGIFVDSAPLARSQASSVTIGRLTWNTLRRIHTPADRPDGLSLETAERVGRAVAVTSTAPVSN
jgi:hypothetical protein